MATNTRWAVPTGIQQLMNTALTSLTNGSLATSSETSGNMASGVYDNSIQLDLAADFELTIEYNAGPPAAGTKVAELYILPVLDGANPASQVSGGQPQKALLIATFESVLPSTSAVERLVALGIPLPPGKFQFVVKNTSGQTLKNGDVCYLKMRPFQLQAA
jgi:hypothetical protein